MTCIAGKVTALIVRQGPAGREVLLFRHPTAGVQIPAGTVEVGEDPLAAGLREAREESGLPNLEIVRELGIRDTELPEGEALLGAPCTVYSRPDPASWDWVHLPPGGRVYVLRGEGDWVQIDFQEPNRFPDPEYLTFRVTGWVRREVICTAVRRHIYLLAPTGPTPDEGWEVDIDYHIFRPFWAPVDEALRSGAGVIQSQRAWLDYLRDAWNETPLQPGPGPALS